MARPRLDTDRPRCPRGHAGEVLLAGRRVWKGGIFCRQRFLCVPSQGRRHKFTLPHRQPTQRHPDGDTCPTCDGRMGRSGGPLTAVDHRFSAAEIAALLIRLGRGGSLRAASQAARLDAQRQAVDGLASRQADLAADYLDAFGPAIEAAVHPPAWPPILILDSKPLGVRAYDAADERSELRAGALLMAAGMLHPGEPARCWRIGLGPDETAASWFDFLGEIDAGDPEWVVCDGASAIANAARQRWPRAIVYACEYHLRRNLEAVAHADGLALDPSLAPAVRRAQWSIADWEALAELVAARGASHLLAWIGLRDALVRRQIQARRTHRGYPRGNGAAESLLAPVAESIGARRGTFRNARRLRLVLALMRAELAGEGDPARYARLIKERIEAAGGRPRIAWTAHQDPRSAPSSLTQLLLSAHQRVATVDPGYRAAAKVRSVQRMVAAVNLGRAAADLPPLEATIRPGRRTPSVKVAGRLLSDFPDLYAEWADDLNPIDKRAVRAGSGYVAHWRCAQGHVWRAPVGQRTVRQSRCATCVGTRGSAATSLAARWPELVAEWDHEANRPLTPERTAITSRRAVWWRCLANPDHPPYKMAPRTRGATDIGCGVCRRERRERERRRPAA